MVAMGSMQYTIGTALERAREGGLRVEVLVDNHWLDGLVVASDGLGVVLDNEGHDHCVVRLESITAVRVCAAAPDPDTLKSDPPDEARLDGAMPMPGPKFAVV